MDLWIENSVYKCYRLINLIWYKVCKHTWREKRARERANEIERQRFTFICTHSSTQSFFQIQWRKHPSLIKTQSCLWDLNPVPTSSLMNLKQLSSQLRNFHLLCWIIPFSPQGKPQEVLTLKRRTDIMSFSSYHSFCLLVFTKHCSEILFPNLSSLSPSVPFSWTFTVATLRNCPYQGSPCCQMYCLIPCSHFLCLLNRMWNSELLSALWTKLFTWLLEHYHVLFSSNLLAHLPRSTLLFDFSCEVYLDI